jgi:hypothetical protein
MRGQIFFQVIYKGRRVSAKPLRFRLNNVLEAHALFFPIANGDDALAFAIPLKVVAGYFLWAARRESKKRSHIHLTCDDLVLSLEHLVFPNEIPDANWPNRVQGRLRDRAVKVGAYRCPTCQLRRNNILWGIHEQLSCSERGRCTLYQGQDSLSIPLTIRRGL